MSKNKKIALPIILSLMAAAIVAVVVLLKRKKWKWYELTDEGKKYLQFYTIDNNAEATESDYVVSAEHIYADASKFFEATTVNGKDYFPDLVKVKAFKFKDNRKDNLKGDQRYVRWAFIIK